MQTFLPYPNFVLVAGCLDNKRLGNQCYRETLTLIRGGWKNHPAAKMWKGYEYLLALYGYHLAQELICRGYIETGVKWRDFYYELYRKLPDDGYPWWMGDKRLHASHRASLLAKAPEWYSKFGWHETPEIKYWWPV